MIPLNVEDEHRIVIEKLCPVCCLAVSEDYRNVHRVYEIWRLAALTLVREAERGNKDLTKAGLMRSLTPIMQ